MAYRPGRAWTRSGWRMCSPGSRRRSELRVLPDVHQRALEHVEVVEGVAGPADRAELRLGVSMDVDAGGGGDRAVEPFEAGAAAAEQGAVALDVAHQPPRGVGENRVDGRQDRPHVSFEAPVQLGRGDRHPLLAALT